MKTVINNDINDSALSVGSVEYANCTSAKEYNSTNQQWGYLLVIGGNL